MPHLTHTWAEAERGVSVQLGLCQGGNTVKETEGRTLTACGDTTPLEMHKTYSLEKVNNNKMICSQSILCSLQTLKKRAAKCHLLFH